MNKNTNEKIILRTVKDLGKVLILMLDEAAIIAVVLLVLYLIGIQLTLTIKISAGIIFVISVLARHVAVIPSFHRKQVTGREGMIGEEGKVVNSLTPVGTINIKGEYWSAKSIDDRIDAGENVEIVGFEGLTLTVKRKGH